MIVVRKDQPVKLELKAMLVQLVLMEKMVQLVLKVQPVKLE